MTTTRFVFSRWASHLGWLLPLGLAGLSAACGTSPSTVGVSAGGSPAAAGGSPALGGASSATGGSGEVVIQGGSSPTAGSDAGGAMPGGGVPSTMGGATSSGGTSSGGATSSGGSGGGGTTVDPYSGPFKILILSTTLEFQHDSIPDCQYMLGLDSAKAAVTSPPTPLGQTPDAMMPAGTKPGSQFTADLATDDLAQFTDATLKNYAMVFSCSPTGTVFSNNPKVQNKAVAMAALQKFVEGGGAWGGVHSATDFEKTNGFPWFTNTLVGGFFDHHDNDGTQGTVQMQAAFATHPVMKGLSTTYPTQDEWYYMNRDITAQPGFQILAKLGSDQRPVVWIKELCPQPANGMCAASATNGRMFYTIRGHNKTVYKEAEFRKVILNGVLWATHRLNQ
jgi:type 1 glutamine amidotransferase